MSLNIYTFTDDAWQDYLWRQSQDRKTVKRINRMIQEIRRSPFSGMGKPEPLKYQFSGAWSRRINDEDRLIYMVKNDEIIFLSLKDHYK